MKDILKGGFNLLHRSPARREDFQVVNESNVYTLKFCASRWVENKCVGDRMVEVWPNKLKYAEDKIALFSFTCSIVEPYLMKCQREKPMVRFMYLDLKSIVTNLLQLIVNPEMLEKCKTAKQLAEINLNGKRNLLPINKVELGFGVHGLHMNFLDTALF